VSLHGGPVPARRHSLYSIFRYKAGAMAPVLGTEGAAHAARGAVGRGHASLLAILDVSFSLGVITQCGAAERVTVVLCIEPKVLALGRERFLWHFPCLQRMSSSPEGGVLRGAVPEEEGTRQPEECPKVARRVCRRHSVSQLFTMWIQATVHKTDTTM
jgi:hypothetical protein